MTAALLIATAWIAAGLVVARIFGINRLGDD